MKAFDAGRYAAVRQLDMMIDQQVLKERELISLKARQAVPDLRGMTLPLLKRQQQLKKRAGAAMAKVAA